MSRARFHGCGLCPFRSFRPCRRFGGLRGVRLVLLSLLLVLPLGAAEVALATSGGATVLRITEPPVQTVQVGRALIFEPPVAGGAPDVTWETLPAGARVAGPGGLLLWRPSSDQVGRHRLRYLVDVGRRRVAMTVTVDVHHPHRPYDVVAMGDSIASGHGLQRGDYLGLDPCWRAASASYPGRVFAALVRGWESDPDGPVARGEVTPLFHQVACSGAVTSELETEPVGGGAGSFAAMGPLSQLEWARRVNPGLITLTVGANDLRFDRPGDFFDRGRFLPDVARARVDAMASDLEHLLAELVRGTDSTIVVTTLHNPTSGRPQGVNRCRGDCFVAATDQVVSMFSEAVHRVARPFRGRVIVVDFADVLDGHGAPNGRGPDFLRAGGGFITRHLPVPTRGIHPFCRRGHGDEDTWVNAADCVHPNGEGHRAMAVAVLAGLGGTEAAVG